MESVNDYADITLETPQPENAVAEAINACAPVGLRVSTVTFLEPGPGAAALVEAADYVWDINLNDIEKTKSGVKPTDMRPDIFEINYNKAVFMRLSAGSARFLNPLTVAELIALRLGLDAPCSPLPFKRLELYRRDGQGNFTPL
jgi:hypothetical protein